MGELSPLVGTVQYSYGATACRIHAICMSVSICTGDCCKLCCYSTPYASIVALAVATVGLVGFLCSAVHGVVQLSSSELLGN